MSVLEQGFSATSSWVADEYVTRGLIEGNKGFRKASSFLWMDDLKLIPLKWACLGLFCGVPMVLLQFMYTIIMQVL